MGYKSHQFKTLGKNFSAPLKPDPSILDKVNNPKIKIKYCVRLTCPEFTSICPITAQPDFAHLIIDYIPKKHIVESKSFKLYLQSYRNYGAFHEDCTITIAEDLQNLLKPIWIRIAGYWYPRGGIPIDIFWQSQNKPNDVYIPELKSKDFRGRD